MNKSLRSPPVFSSAHAFSPALSGNACTLKQLTSSQPHLLKDAFQRFLAGNLLHKFLAHGRDQGGPAIKPRLRPIEAEMMRAEELGWLGSPRRLRLRAWWRGAEGGGVEGRESCRCCGDRCRQTLRLWFRSDFPAGLVDRRADREMC